MDKCGTIPIPNIYAKKLTEKDDLMLMPDGVKYKRKLGKLDKEVEKIKTVSNLLDNLNIKGANSETDKRKNCDNCGKKLPTKRSRFCSDEYSKEFYEKRIIKDLV